MDWDEKINRRIIEARKAFGYTQKEFADNLKLSRTYLGEIEANRRRVNDRIVKLIAVTYGVSVEWLKTGAGTMFDQIVDPRLEQLVTDFKKLDDPLKDYVLKQLDFLVKYMETNQKSG
ncbi:MAG: helix-turn-helix transcriptional regulator [Treponema sp.]|nr:helix-turn-helix transcriptional regulator [Treponema sp.]